jgi:pimeloyl-ACP methyl ester carboxylesterase
MVTMKYLFRNTTIRMLISGVVVALTAAVACEARSPLTVPTCTQLNRMPVLFVHGSGLSASSWDTMIEAFVERGYWSELLVAVDLRPRDGDNVRAAREFLVDAAADLLGKAQNLRVEHGCDGSMTPKLNIVTHSMGAFSGRWFVAFLAPDKVRTFVAIAGANHGTNALCGRSGSGDQQMCPAFASSTAASTAQFTLNGSPSQRIDETPFGEGTDTAAIESQAPDAQRSIAYFTIRIEPDPWIVPASSAILDGAGGPVRLKRALFSQATDGNFLFRDKSGHDELPSEPAVIRLVLDMLASTDPTTKAAIE